MISNITPKEIQSLLDSIDILLEIKAFIRNNVPDYHLDEVNSELFLSLLNTLKSKLQPLFVKYLQVPTTKANTNSNSYEELLLKIKKKMGKNNYILVSANHSKKILKNIGFDPTKLIISGGPLIFKNYIKVNPELNESAFQGIKRKCDKIINLLNNINWRDSHLIFIYEGTNKTDLIILDELKELEKIIGIEVELLDIKSWKHLQN